MTAERALRFLDHEARECRALAYAAPCAPRSEEELMKRMNTLEAFALLLPALLKITGLEPMDDLEAPATRYLIKQELIGHNGHVQA